MGRKVIHAMGGEVRGKNVAVLGLTFKPNTDDMRDSPAIAVIRALQDAGANVRAFDPEGMEQAKLVLEDVTYAGGAYEAVEGSDALVIATEWDAFRALDLERVRSLMNEPIMVDLRNIYLRSEVEAAGFRYFAIGR
jgi:UDPglucose 6-dehydrogenase